MTWKYIHKYSFKWFSKESTKNSCVYVHAQSCLTLYGLCTWPKKNSYDSKMTNSIKNYNGEFAKTLHKEEKIQLTIMHMKECPMLLILAVWEI